MSIQDDLFGAPEKRINSKVKGNDNERRAAKLLKKWTGFEFIRTPASGGFRLKDAPNFCGDLVCADSSVSFPFSIETKHIKALTVKPKLTKNSGVYKHWEQAYEDARRADKHPFLMVRKDGMPKGEYYVFVSEYVAGVLGILPIFDGGHIKGCMFTGLPKYTNKIHNELNVAIFECLHLKP
jgi:Holliday junction resolvase